MNTPIPQAVLEGTLIYPQLDKLVRSPTQPRIRKGFDDGSLADLASSIQSFGVAQPILIRDAGADKYEIVCGERRWRSARLAGLGTIPALLRTLTDHEVVQIQLIENTQREDLDALEEAEGYERLMKLTDPNTGTLYTVEKIAELQGTSKGTIYARLKLLDLCEKGRKALFENKIDTSTALLIARISPEKIQLEALNDILQQDMSYRRAQNHIQQKFMLELKTAIFDTKDAALLKKAGSCDGCPKRTGNQPGLFDDIKNKDVCTDPVCFAMKKTAHFLNIRNKAEAEGAKVIAGKEAQKILPSKYSTDYYLNESGYAKPNEKIPNDPKGRTWEQALKQTKLLEAKEGEKPRLQPTLIENPHEKGEIIQAINIEQAAKALREQGYEVSLRGASTGKPAKTDKEKAEAEKLRAQTKAENLYRSRLVQAIHTKADEDLNGATPQLRPEIFRLLAIEIFDQSKAYSAKTELVTAHLGEEAAKKGTWEANKLFKNHLETLSPQACMLIMVDLIMAPEETVEGWQVQQKNTPDVMLALAGIHEIDAATIKKQAELEIKTEVEAKKKAKEAKKPAATKKTTAANPAKKDAKAPAAAATKVRPAAEWPFPAPPLKT
jgi:ParB/RepB/Spo0J family partition protein